MLRSEYLYPTLNVKGSKMTCSICGIFLEVSYFFNVTHRQDHNFMLKHILLSFISSVACTKKKYEKCDKCLPFSSFHSPSAGYHMFTPIRDEP